MTRNRCFLFVAAIFVTQYIAAQSVNDSLKLRVHVKYGNNPLELYKKYITPTDTIELHSVKFYLSQLEIEYEDHTRVTSQKKYHLVDINHPSSYEIPIALQEKKSITRVSFGIGVDSTASVSGALSGDLDPSKGMYWAWQSGYINIKIEGKSKNCKTRKNQFQFHLGGYQKPNNAFHFIELKVLKKSYQPDIVFDLEQFFSQIELSKINSIMIPGQPAMALSALASKIFSIE